MLKMINEDKSVCVAEIQVRSLPAYWQYKEKYGKKENRHVWFYENDDKTKIAIEILFFEFNKYTRRILARWNKDTNSFIEEELEIDPWKEEREQARTKQKEFLERAAARMKQLQSECKTDEEIEQIMNNEFGSPPGHSGVLISNGNNEQRDNNSDEKT